MSDGSDAAAIAVAIISGSISGAISILSIIMSKKNEFSLENIRTDLEIKKDEQAARRDYEYEARKRLYEEYEPILFQFAELSESALLRIYALAKNARDGNLGPDRFWLTTDQYFIRSTIYRLFTPLAAFKILQRRLTSVDLKLDNHINIQYRLAKILYYVFSSPYDISESEPPIPYDPDMIYTDKVIEEEKKKDLERNFPEKYRLQHLKVGTLDRFAEMLIFVEGDKKNVRIKSFGEFELEFFGDKSINLTQNNNNNNNKFEKLFELFSYFHPNTRPVLWRALIIQAHLYNAIIKIRKKGKEEYSDFEQIKILFDMEKTKMACKWIQPNELISDDDFLKPFEASENYLKKQLKDVF